MYPEVIILGHNIRTYWLAALTGILVCSVVAYMRHRKFKELQQVDVTNAAALLFVGVLIGGRLLSAVTMLPVLIRNWEVIMADISLAYILISNGMVFYGGLFGAIIMLHIYTRKYGLGEKSFMDFFAPLFPLFHAFGRVGCFLTGCCHGFVSERYGIAYSTSISSQNGVPYFPIQLVSAIGNLLIFAAVLLLERKHFKRGRNLRTYLMIYAPCRFIIEFFRGDAIRGIYFGLSTSQWISLGIVIYLTITHYKTTNHSAGNYDEKYPSDNRI